MRVRIGKALAADYMTRGVFEFIEDAGLYDLTEDQTGELLRDAAYYCDKNGPDQIPATLRAVYKRLLEGLQ